MSQISSSSDKMAVLLNANARRVTDRVKRRMAQAAPDARIVLTESTQQTQDFLREALAGGYGRIVSGGGDGTLVTVATMIRDEVAAIRERMGDSGSAPQFPLPELGVLKLGTGNAVADLLSCSDPVQDLRAMCDLPTVSQTRLDLLQIERKSAPFCGFGYDALILNDYIAVKKRFAKTFLKPVIEGVWGYLLAAGLKSIPKTIGREIRRKRVVARIMNAGGKIYRVSFTHGLTEVDVGEQDLFYSGPITMLSCGTVPYYGFRFNMFPFSRILPGFAHLRVARSSAWEAARNLRAVWSGTYSSPTIDDFLVERVRIRFSEPMPFQIGGDAAGYRKELVFGVHEEPFHVVDLGSLGMEDDDADTEAEAA